MPSSPRCVTLEIGGPLDRGDLPGLLERTCALLDRTRPTLLCCEVGAVEADAVAVEALAQVALAARRHEAHLFLGGASGELLDLLALMGLADVLATGL